MRRLLSLLIFMPACIFTEPPEDTGGSDETTKWPIFSSDDDVSDTGDTSDVDPEEDTSPLDPTTDEATCGISDLFSVSWSYDGEIPGYSGLDGGCLVFEAGQIIVAHESDRAVIGFYIELDAGLLSDMRYQWLPVPVIDDRSDYTGYIVIEDMYLSTHETLGVWPCDVGTEM